MPAPSSTTSAPSRQNEAETWPTEPTTHGISAYGPLPPRHADVQRQAAFIASKLQTYTNQVRVWEISGLGLDHDEADIFCSCIRIARDCGLPLAAASAAARRVWSQSSTTARQYVDDLRRAVYPLARAGSPGQQIVAVAEDVNHRYGYVLPYDKLVLACRVIAASAVPQPWRRK